MENNEIYNMCLIDRDGFEKIVEVSKDLFYGGKYVVAKRPKLTAHSSIDETSIDPIEKKVFITAPQTYRVIYEIEAREQ